MGIDAQAAFDRMIAALEEFHRAVQLSRDPHSPAIQDASDALADAYTVYDDVLFRNYGVEGPFDTYLADEDEFDDDDYDEYDALADDDDDLDGELDDDDDLEYDDEGYYVDEGDDDDDDDIDEDDLDIFSHKND